MFQTPQWHKCLYRSLYSSDRNSDCRYEFTVQKRTFLATLWHHHAMTSSWRHHDISAYIAVCIAQIAILIADMNSCCKSVYFLILYDIITQWHHHDVMTIQRHKCLYRSLYSSDRNSDCRYEFVLQKRMFLATLGHHHAMTSSWPHDVTMT
jgi:hypothetical protein